MVIPRKCQDTAPFQPLGDGGDSAIRRHPMPPTRSSGAPGEQRYNRRTPFAVGAFGPRLRVAAAAAFRGGEWTWPPSALSRRWMVHEVRLTRREGGGAGKAADAADRRIADRPRATGYFPGKVVHLPATMQPPLSPHLGAPRRIEVSRGR